MDFLGIGGWEILTAQISKEFEEQEKSKPAKVDEVKKTI
jgi:hypothetical protein